MTTLQSTPIEVQNEAVNISSPNAETRHLNGHAQSDSTQTNTETINSNGGSLESTPTRPHLTSGDGQDVNTAAGEDAPVSRSPEKPRRGSRRGSKKETAGGKSAHVARFEKAPLSVYGRTVSDNIGVEPFSPEVVARRRAQSYGSGKEMLGAAGRRSQKQPKIQPVSKPKNELIVDTRNQGYQASGEFDDQSSQSSTNSAQNVPVDNSYLTVGIKGKAPQYRRNGSGGSKLAVSVGAYRDGVSQSTQYSPPVRQDSNTGSISPHPADDSDDDAEDTEDSEGSEYEGNDGDSGCPIAPAGPESDDEDALSQAVDDDASDASSYVKEVTVRIPAQSSSEALSTSFFSGGRAYNHAMSPLTAPPASGGHFNAMAFGLPAPMQPHPGATSASFGIQAGFPNQMQFEAALTSPLSAGSNLSALVHAHYHHHHSHAHGHGHMPMPPPTGHDGSVDPRGEMSVYGSPYRPPHTPHYSPLRAHSHAHHPHVPPIDWNTAGFPSSPSFISPSSPLPVPSGVHGASLMPSAATTGKLDLLHTKSQKRGRGAGEARDHTGVSAGEIMPQQQTLPIPGDNANLAAGPSPAFQIAAQLGRHIRTQQQQQQHMPPAHAASSSHPHPLHNVLRSHLGGLHAHQIPVVPGRSLVSPGGSGGFSAQTPPSATRSRNGNNTGNRGSRKETKSYQQHSPTTPSPITTPSPNTHQSNSTNDRRSSTSHDTTQAAEHQPSASTQASRQTELGQEGEGGIHNPLANASKRSLTTTNHTPPNSFILSPVPNTAQLHIKTTWGMKEAAGAVAGRLRKREPLQLSFRTADDLNHGIKTLCLARTYVHSNNLSITCRVEWDYGTIVILARASAAINETEPQDDAQVIRVAGKQGPPPIQTAGLIANRIRDYNRAYLLCMGADSVAQAMRAISITHNFVEDKDQDLYFRALFLTLRADEGTRSAIRIIVEQTPPTFINVRRTQPTQKASQAAEVPPPPPPPPVPPHLTTTVKISEHSVKEQKSFITKVHQKPIPVPTHVHVVAHTQDGDRGV